MLPLLRVRNVERQPCRKARSSPRSPCAEKTGIRLLGLGPGCRLCRSYRVPQGSLGCLDHLHGIDDVVDAVSFAEILVVVLGVIHCLFEGSRWMRTGRGTRLRDLPLQCLAAGIEARPPPLHHTIGQAPVALFARGRRRSARSLLVADIAIHVDRSHSVRPFRHQSGAFPEVHGNLLLVQAAHVALHARLCRLPLVVKAGYLVLDGRMTREALDLVVRDVVGMEELGRVFRFHLGPCCYGIGDRRTQGYGRPRRSRSCGTGRI